MIGLMLSVSLSPQVITLSGFHCSKIFVIIWLMLSVSLCPQSDNIKQLPLYLEYSHDEASLRKNY